MVQQDVGQLRDIGQQSSDGALGQLGKSIVGGSKDCEGTFSLERVDQVSRAQGSSQGGEATIRYGGVDDVDELPVPRA
jgi:hypothetical protein